VYGVDEPADKLLASCYRNALRLAEKNQLRSIAFPAISTGAFGYPLEPAARITFVTLLEELDRLSSVRHIRFVLYDKESLSLHERLLEDILPSEHH